MAARGARSRKVVEKVIEKEESRRYADRFNSFASTPDPSRVVSPVAGWRRKPSVTIGSGGDSVWSAESGGSSSKMSGSGAKRIAHKIASMAPNEDDTFVTKGRQTIAPRGRGGGVPVKTLEKEQDRARMRSVKAGRLVGSSLGTRPGSVLTEHSETSSTLRPWATTKVWSGGLTPPKSYKGFEHDDDMWMSDGNCLIFFAEETNEDDPRPMCRIHTKTLEQARSVFMINLLRYGEIVVDEDEITPTATSDSTTNSKWPLMDGSLYSMDEVMNDESTLHSSFAPISSRGTSTGTWNSSQTAATPKNQGRGNMSMSSDQGASFPDPESLDKVSSITHEIWFRAPSHITRSEIQRRHHIATRNYLALLYGLPIIGSDFHEMLSDLQNVMDTYYELNDPSDRWDSAQVLITYLKSRKLDDVRGNLSACLGLMAWSEQSSVRWEAGYMEGFVHAVGMMTSKTVDMREFKLLSQVSRHKLQNAYNALQLRLIEAEERLADFEFPELWYAEGVAVTQPAQRAYDEFRSFLNCFYATVWTNWPPKEKDHQKHWLSRTVVNRLQADLGALYDYIVDRDISWDASEERHTRKWEMVANSSFRSSTFHPDIPGLPITNMLVGFDSSLRYDHIPHPFPLLPTSGTSVKGKPTKKSIFGRFGSKKEVPVVIAGPKEQYQMALAFNAATNVDLLGTAFKENKLLDTFQHHEKSFPPSVLPPADARLGRWILLYAILQVLSTLSVDVSGLKYSDKIRYFACPSIDGLPPWRSPVHPHHHPNAAPAASSASTTPMKDATQSMSYCWTAPTRWGPPPSSSAASPMREQRPPSSTPPAYEGPPSAGAGANKSPSVTLPVRSVPNKNSMAEVDEHPQPLPRPAIGPRLFPTIAPIGGLAEQRHAFAGGYGSKVGSPLGRDRTNAFANGARRDIS